MKAYYNGQVFTGEKILSNKCVLTEDNKINKTIDHPIEHIQSMLNNSVFDKDQGASLISYQNILKELHNINSIKCLPLLVSVIISSIHTWATLFIINELSLKY